MVYFKIFFDFLRYCVGASAEALLKEKPKEFAWLLGEVERMMGHSRIADDVIKEGIRNLIKEHPKNYYLKNYLGSVL